MIKVVRLVSRVRRLLAGWTDWLRAGRRRWLLTGAGLLVGAGLLAGTVALAVMAVRVADDRAAQDRVTQGRAAGSGASVPASGVGESAGGTARAEPSPTGAGPIGGAPQAGAGTVAPTATATALPPPPRIHPFAQQPSRTPQPALPSPTAPLTVQEGNDGCDHGYGDRNVCVPWQFPPGVTDYCGWLAGHGYPPLKVHNARDRHGLDTNRDGVACGPGDAGG